MSEIMITAVDDKVREFKTDNGQFGAFKVWFKTAPDGPVLPGEVVAKTDNVGKRIGEFKGYINKLVELLVEDQGSFADGSPKPKKVKIPQKPGGNQGQAAWRNTKEGFEAEQAMWARKQEIEQDSIHRSVALKLACKHFAEIAPDIGGDTEERLRRTFHLMLRVLESPRTSGSER